MAGSSMNGQDISLLQCIMLFGSQKMVSFTMYQKNTILIRLKKEQHF